MSSTTIIIALTEAKKQLDVLDAEVLLGHVLKLTRPELYLNGRQSVSEKESGEYQTYIQRRLAGEPVAYITGVKEFWSIPIKVTPAVLVPRPETEMLVEQTLEIIKEFRSQNSEVRIKILDLCTGSGCITVALAKELPNATFVSSDLSPEALEVARENCRSFQDRVRLVQSDLFSALKGEIFDIIVSNPPYLTSDLCKKLPKDILEHEPQLAIDGGPDGKSISDRILQDIALYLKPTGFLVMELGPEILTYSQERLKNLRRE